VIDEKQGVYEVLMAIKRAGADLIISYHAKDLLRWRREGWLP
jgi:porphobilinogen synthase